MDQIVVRTAELIETQVDGDMVALDVERGTCLGFNTTASRIWALTSQPIATSSLIARLSDEFDIDPATCATDVEALLDTMKAQGLVRLDAA